MALQFLQARIIQERALREISEITPSDVDESAFSFTNWRQLSIFKHPFRNLLILDLYLLGNKSNQKCKDNIIPLLNSFSSFINNSTFELTIVTKEIPGARDGNPVDKIEESYANINRAYCKLIYYDEQVAASNGLLKERSGNNYQLPSI